jgi:hypothetical protein
MAYMPSQAAHQHGYEIPAVFINNSAVFVSPRIEIEQAPQAAQSTESNFLAWAGLGISLLTIPEVRRFLKRLGLF